MSAARKSPKSGKQSPSEVAKKNKGGRPPEPVPKEQAEAICRWVSQGKTLKAYTEQKGTPSFSTVYLWVAKDEEFAAAIAHAREVGHDAISEDCFKIADEVPPKDVAGHTDSGYVAWQKNRLWTRTQLLAKWNPKKYGEKVGVAVSGDVRLVVATGVPDAG